MLHKNYDAHTSKTNNKKRQKDNQPRTRKKSKQQQKNTKKKKKQRRSNIENQKIEQTTNKKITQTGKNSREAGGGGKVKRPPEPRRAEGGREGQHVRPKK